MFRRVYFYLQKPKKIQNAGNWYRILNDARIQWNKGIVDNFKSVHYKHVQGTEKYILLQKNY